MKRRKVLRYLALAGVLVLLASSLLSGCGQQPAAEKPGGKTITVGIIDSYTGPPSAYTQDALDGFQLAINEVAKQGGPTIKFIKRDDEFKVDKAQSWAKELVMQQKVDVLAGTINSGGTLAVSQYAKENKIPFFDWGGMSDKITGASGHRYVFSMLPNTAMIGKAGAVQMSKLPYTKYWLAGSDYEYGHSVVNNLWSNLQKLKPDVQKVGETWWKVGEPDFTPYIASIRAAKPDAVIVGTGGADMVPFMKALQNTGLAKDIPVWIHTATDAGTLKPLGDNAPVGVLGTNAYFYYYPDTAANKAFDQAFSSAYNRHPTAFALFGYMTGKFLAAAVEKAGTDKEKIIDAMEGMTVDSPIGPMTMRKEDHLIQMNMFYGKTGKDASGKVVATEINTLPADQVMPNIDDVLKQRSK